MKYTAIAATALAMILVVTGCKKETTTERADTVTPKKDSIILSEQDFVFGDDRPFPQCHASTLVRTNDDHFLVAWFGGTHEKHDDVGIWLSKGKMKHWSAPVEVAKVREEPKFFR
jgi:hypothetical protein